MKNKKLGISYMGSKRKLSGEIVDHILTAHPNTKYVWDLFGGGVAISFEFLQRRQIERVVYNELNTGVVELLRKNLGNAIKYIWRADLKNDAIEDLKKAVWYLQDEIKKREK